MEFFYVTDRSQLLFILHAKHIYLYALVSCPIKGVNWLNIIRVNLFKEKKSTGAYIKDKIQNMHLYRLVKDVEDRVA